MDKELPAVITSEALSPDKIIYSTGRAKWDLNSSHGHLNSQRVNRSVESVEVFMLVCLLFIPTSATTELIGWEIFYGTHGISENPNI